jgi:Fusaric acid resistance protein-like
MLKISLCFRRWPGRRDLGVTMTAMAAILATYGSALAVERLAGLRLDIVIQAVVLAMTLARIQRSADMRDRLAGFVLLPAVAVAGWAVGHLIATDADAGDALFVLVMSASVWVRRFGPRASRAGMLIVSPLIAVLIVGAGGPGQAPLGWVVVIALIACAWVSVFQLLATRIGLARAAPSSQPAVPRSAGSGRLRASSRMALQLGVALAAAFAVGRTLWPDHWAWVVLTAFIVCSGARGRGDVLLKGVLRAGGAAAGTVVAAAIAGTFGPRADATVVVMFTGLAVATWLREYSYAYWAGIVTAVLSLLYGWFGESPGGLLDTRLEGILAGAALGIAASWLVLPVRTEAVLRRRSADAMAALGSVLSADWSHPSAVPAFERSVDQLRQLAQPLRAQRFLLSRWYPDRRFGADAIDAVERCSGPVRVLAASDKQAGSDAYSVRALSGNVAAVRRAIGRRPGARYHPVAFGGDGGQSQVIAALREIDGALGLLSEVFASRGTCSR